IGSPFGFLRGADDTDKQAVPLALICFVSIAAVLIGLLLTFLEYNQPLGKFRGEVERFGKGSADQLTPSKLRGAYGQLAVLINEGVEKVAVKGGAPRRAADLDAVLGPIPQQPAMSAFSIPQSPPASQGAAPSARATGPTAPVAPPPAAPAPAAPAPWPPPVPAPAPP